MSTISQFTSLIQPDVLSCPAPIVNREVLSTLIEFCEKTHVLTKELTLTIDSDDIDEDRQDSIDFDVYEYIGELRPIGITNLMVDGLSYLAKRRDIGMTHTNWDALKEEGTKFFWIPENHLIRVFDISANDSSIYMKLVCKPQRNFTEVDDFLLEDYQEAIVSGAKWKLLSSPGKEWSDPNAGEYYRLEWRRFLSAAKAKAINNLPGLQDQVNPVDFEYGA